MSEENPVNPMKLATTERLVYMETDGKRVEICSWQRGIDRAENNKPIAIFDINYEWLEKKDWEELNMENAKILVSALNNAIADAESHGF